jgi:hypothetical protein
VFTIVAQSTFDHPTEDAEHQQLDHMADVLRGTRGFVRGAWARDDGEPKTLWGLLTFGDREQASEFAAQVEAAGAARWLRITEVLAQASRLPAE